MITHETIPYDTFSSVDMRLGRIVDVQSFPEARKPAYKLSIDFGPEIGIKKSSAQITEHYMKEDLVGRLVLGVVNFAPKQIGPFLSECLTLGVSDRDGKVVLLGVDKVDVPLGARVF